MADAVIFSDAHASDEDSAAVQRLLDFLAGPCAGARRVFILGDLFDFWCGAKQAAFEPYRRILDAISALRERGAAVAFYHGNRDFYVDEKLAARYGFLLVRDCSTETICGRRVTLCHGDMLCTNDVRYHLMRALLRNPVVAGVLTRLPAAFAMRLARGMRRRSARAVRSKAQWVVGINDDAVREEFRKGADVVVCGHTHKEGRRLFDTPSGPREFYTLGDFGLSGSYLECAEGRLTLRTFPS